MPSLRVSRVEFRDWLGSGSLRRPWTVVLGIANVKLDDRRKERATAMKARKEEVIVVKVQFSGGGGGGSGQ